MARDLERAYIPSHPKLFYVNFKPGEFNSGLVARKGFATNELITRIEGTTRGPKAYSSVQCGPGEDDHIELNSDLLYANHSCDPNIAFDLSSRDPSGWHVRALKPIATGEELSFFYPSTEWEMSQPFVCQCGALSCLREIRGAIALGEDELRSRGYVNSWILEAVVQRDAQAARNSRNVA
ncbi:hypothetical protein K488DRAFT_52426 [Vararia minispora EC-137]|uniref:Uncharacterized protein n=1 Tax=Vararia minispora EC-137 TaxID=1314806 RepID=A0ACB8QHI2_9AGAM|nr:hypothetical protein K488DRAFT_52426 [Vararia minispora EC-137]